MPLGRPIIIIHRPLTLPSTAASILRTCTQLRRAATTLLAAISNQRTTITMCRCNTTKGSKTTRLTRHSRTPHRPLLRSIRCTNGILRTHSKRVDPSNVNPTRQPRKLISINSFPVHFLHCSRTHYDTPPCLIDSTRFHRNATIFVP